MDGLALQEREAARWAIATRYRRRVAGPRSGERGCRSREPFAGVGCGLRNPVDLWLSGGGKFHRKARRKISAPAEVLPCWRAGIEGEVNNPAIRDALWFGLYTGMRRDEVLTLRWERVDMDALTFRVEETKTGVPLELPITSQLAAILERRRAAAADLAEGVGEWVFPSPTSATGHVQDPHRRRDSTWQLIPELIHQLVERHKSSTPIGARTR